MRSFLQKLLFVCLVAVSTGGAFSGTGAGEMLDLPHGALQRLVELRATPKFEAEEAFGYVGFLPLDGRPAAEAELDLLIDRIIAGIEANPTKGFVLSEFRRTFVHFVESDTEDRERLMRYFEQIMNLVGMDTSDGALNRMLYEFG